MRTDPRELPVVFDVRGDRLVGILHGVAEASSIGVLIVTGGPQYRVGSHRQFVLLARQLATAGIPAMRFDLRGMGDSGGEPTRFDEADDDIRAALDCFFEHQPAVEKVVLWGLCDAASAAMMYAHRDRRIGGIVALNPWARTEAGEAKTLFTHYYGRRLLSRDFWNGVLRGRFRPLRAVRALLSNLRRALAGIRDSAHTGDATFIEKMESGLANFDGPVLFIISGDDLTASEFLGVVNASPSWQRLLHRDRCSRKDLPHANHTFSSTEWRQRVEAWTIDWVRGIRDA